MKERLFKFELRGVTPLLMHCDSIEGADAVAAWSKDPANKGKSKAGDDRTPGWTWHSYLYNDGSAVALPSLNLMTCLRKAAAQVVMPNGKNGKTFKELSQSAIWLADDFLTFTTDGKPVNYSPIVDMRDAPFAEQAERVRGLGFALDVRRAAVGQSKHVRVRPRFDDWSVSGRLSLRADAEVFPDAILSQVFEIAGDRVGLGDWRPGSKTPGRFGMFTATVAKAK